MTVTDRVSVAEAPRLKRGSERYASAPSDSPTLDTTISFTQCSGLGRLSLWDPILG
jgi:hypothetical protein